MMWRAPMITLLHRERIAKRYSRTEAPVTERLFLWLGTDATFLADVFGDLAEERAMRIARDGTRSAQGWYLRECVRSTPHLVQNALKYGGGPTLAKLGFFAAALLASLGIAIFLYLGAPARLLPNAGEVASGIIVNNVDPVYLQMRVLDRTGKEIEAKGLHFRQIGGAPMEIREDGLVGCKSRSDAKVRVTFEKLVTDIDVRCRPVRDLRATVWMDFLVTDSSASLPFVAVGVDGLQVSELRGRIRVADSTVATIDGTTIRPLRQGRTFIDLYIGDRFVRVGVAVHRLVNSFAELRPNDQAVAVTTAVARNDTLRWELPRGVYWIKYLSRRPGEAPPSILVEGDAGCVKDDPLRARIPIRDVYARYCLVRAGGAHVVVAHGAEGSPVVEGALALEVIERR